MKLRDVLYISSETINPMSSPSDSYLLFSLPAFDDDKKPEKVLGKDVQSNKFIVPNKCILFNKLNVRFRRIWKVSSNETNKIASTEFLPLVVNEEIIDFNYLYYFLFSERITNYLCGPTTNTSGSHKRIDPDFLLDIDIELPDINVQRKIGNLLSLFDEKIELNASLDKDIKSYLKMVFDYWFVQYDYPNNNVFVTGNENFPKIPKGWKIGKVGSLAEIIKGVSYDKGDDSDTKLDNYTMLLRSNNIFAGSVNYDSVIYVKNERISTEQILNSGDIFICMSNGSKEHLGKTAIFPSNINKAFGAFCSKIVCKIPEYRGFLDMFFYSDYYKAYIKQICLGTNINNLTNDDILELEILIPPVDIVKEFNDIFDKCLQKLDCCHREFFELIEYRDFLLPLLMSGQATFKDKIKEN